MGLNVIWKYPIIVGENDVEMPKDAEILTVQRQGEGACIWALVDPEKPIQERQFTVYATGFDGVKSDKAHYIGTFQLGWTVWHVFDTSQ